MIKAFLEPLNLLPFLACLGFFGHLWYCKSYLTQRFTPANMRLKSLVRGQALIPILPLTGLIGTIWGLMQTLSYMGEVGNDLANQVGDVLLKFAPCLTTTVIGIAGSITFLFLYNIAINQLEDSIEDK